MLFVMYSHVRCFATSAVPRVIRFGIEPTMLLTADAQGYDVRGIHRREGLFRSRTYSMYPLGRLHMQHVARKSPEHQTNKWLSEESWLPSHTVKRSAQPQHSTCRPGGCCWAHNGPSQNKMPPRRFGLVKKDSGHDASSHTAISKPYFKP